MLNRVAIQNFKSIGEPGVDLELKPLTFLVGPNGGGKSSILEAILFASRFGNLELGFLRFRELGDLHFKYGNTAIHIEIEATDSSGSTGTLKLSKARDMEAERKFLPGRAGGSLSSRLFELEEVEKPRDRLGEDVIRESLFHKVFPITATRGVVDNKMHPTEAAWVGADGGNILDVLERLGHAQHKAKRDKVQKWSSRFGMSDVAASLSGRVELEGSYTDEGLGSTPNLYLASSGSRQVLPVIVQAFWGEEGSVLAIEEPEISLHPRAQIDVLEMFAEAVNEDKQIIATTHSHFMMQAIGYAIHKKWLGADQIAIHHVAKKEGTGTVAEPLALGENGYIEGWIPSFTEVERRLLLEWAETLPRE